MVDSRSLVSLKDALRRLPGVGPKTAQRMAFHLLERDREGARIIAKAIEQAVSAIIHCQRCHNFSETTLCELCASERRDKTQLCIVETPADLDSIESASIFKGTYFVLMGHLSPLDGIGPEQLGIARLCELVQNDGVEEAILATNLTVEGEATADFLAELLHQYQLKVTRLARGVPVGGELEYMDPGTLEQAFEDRRSI